MADISKCLVGDNCAMKGRCYRHTAVDNPCRQSYQMPHIGIDGACLSFWADEAYTTASNEPTGLDKKQ